MEIIAILQCLSRDGRTIVLVTHDQEIAQYTNRIVSLERGRIVADETVEDSKVAFVQEAL